MCFPVFMWFLVIINHTVFQNNSTRYFIDAHISRAMFRRPIVFFRLTMNRSPKCCRRNRFLVVPFRFVESL